MPRSREEFQARLASVGEKVLRGDEKAVEKQHTEGKLTARERIERLLDKGSFVEEFMLAETQCTDFGLDTSRQPTDGVVVGSGAVDGRLVYVYAQDRTVMGGTVGSAHGEKIAYAVDTARKLGIPVIGLNDSPGGRIQEGLDTTRAIGKIIFAHSVASGCIPQISAIMGTCVGVGSYAPALTDFVIMTRGTSQMLVTGPRVVMEVLGEEVTMEELGGARVHSEVSGCADLTAAGDEDCLEQIRRLLSFLPSNYTEKPPRVDTGDDPNRLLDDIYELIPGDMRKSYNMVRVIQRIVDRGDFFEMKPRWARNLVTGFGRLDGYCVGFVANQPAHLAGSLDVDAADKACRFVRFCDAFNIPIITLVDVPGFFPGAKEEHLGIIRHGAKMLYAFSEATVPKLTVYLRKGYRGAKQAMCTRELGADQVYVWPGVELAVMGAEAAVDILYRTEISAATDPNELRRQKIEEFSERFSGPFDALSKQFAHAGILPEETRARLIRALRLLQSKQEHRPPKKHGCMPV